MISHSTKQRYLTMLSILVIIPMGFASKFYSGYGQDWVRNSLGGVPYVIFWCLVVFFFFQDLKPGVIAFIVLTITCILEFLQLWHPAALEYLRKTFIGRTVLGTSFSWSDFPYYFVGAGLGWLWVKSLNRKANRSFTRLRIDRI